MFNITKTKKEITKEQTIIINQMSEGALNDLVINAQMAYDRFWFNELTTPQEICDELGDQAYLLFENSAKTQAFIKSLKPDHEELVIPQGFDVKFNQDGTVTILTIEE